MARIATFFVRTWKALLVVAIVLVAARLAAPSIVKYYLNQRLAELDGYRGHVSDVDLALWRGAYRIQGLTIVKTGEEVPVPFFACPNIDISVEWAPLFDGRVVAEIELTRPEINFVKAGGGSGEQTGEENDWRDAIDDMVPITINRLTVHGGAVHYRDFGSEPRVDLVVDRLEAAVHGLSTGRLPKGELPANGRVDARVQESGRLVVEGRVNPWDVEPTFNMAVKLAELDATSLNDLLRAYVGVDAEAGHVYLYSELRAREGRFHGYVKPMAEGLSIYRPDEEGDPIDLVGDALIGLVQEIFENHGTDRFAVRVPVSGNFDASVSADGWTAVVSVLGNTFIEAIQHGIDRRTQWAEDTEEESPDTETAENPSSARDASNRHRADTASPPSQEPEHGRMARNARRTDDKPD